jgi:hypothetical protein
VGQRGAAPWEKERVDCLVFVREDIKKDTVKPVRGRETRRNTNLFWYGTQSFGTSRRHGLCEKTSRGRPG